MSIGSGNPTGIDKTERLKSEAELDGSVYEYEHEPSIEPVSRKSILKNTGEGSTPRTPSSPQITRSMLEGLDDFTASPSKVIKPSNPSSSATTLRSASPDLSRKSGRGGKRGEPGISNASTPSSTTSLRKRLFSFNSDK